MIPAQLSQALGQRRVLLLFAGSNLLFLLLDVALAHSAFRYSRAELIPLWASGVGGISILALCWISLERLWVKFSLACVAGVNVGVGVLGLFFHLGSQAFNHPSLYQLVYSAPLVAPLSYTGLGLLILCAVGISDPELRGRAMQCLAGLGFLGNFALCLLDHAQNGFWAPVEWVSVAAGAAGGSALLVAAALSRPRPYERQFLGVLLWLMVAVALAGTFFHAWADFHATGSLSDRLRYGAPIFAPLLFADLAVLGALGSLSRARTLPNRAA